MVKYEDKVSEATEELSESVREANRVIAESAVAASERNWKLAQSVFEDEVELFKSHAEGTRTVMEKLIGESGKGQPLFQSVADSAVAAQERNVKFAQGILENGTEVLRSHVEGTRTLMQTLTEQSRKQREAFEVLARGTWDSYRGFFPSPLRYYERAMETVESIVAQGVDTTQKMTRQGMGTTEKATHHERQTAHTATK
ncbi:MAG: hypothetical protein ACXVDN_19845 [Ktedonobacteraceae bacterium]